MVSRIGGNGAANFVDRAWDEILSVNANKASCNSKGAKRIVNSFDVIDVQLLLMSIF